jgi:hypothetical protein
MKGQGVAPSGAEALGDMPAVVNRVRRAALAEGPPDHPLAPELGARVDQAESGLGECRIKR